MSDEQKPDTETLDRLYLEWSQFTESRTGRELDLVTLVRRLCHKLQAVANEKQLPARTKENPEGLGVQKLIDQASDYVKRKGLQGSVLRTE